MELDDLKAHWDALQEKESRRYNIPPEKLNQIIMHTANTIGELHARSSYWSRFGRSSMKALLATLGVVGTIIIIEGAYRHELDNVLVAVAWLLIILLYCVVTIWMYKRQEQLFTSYNSENVKLTLKCTITGFKSFYRTLLITYAALYPAYFYAVIELFMPYWHLSWITVLIISVIAGAVSLLGTHLYYRAKYFKKLRSLEEDLRALESHPL